MLARHPLEDFIVPERSAKLREVLAQRTKQLTLVVDQIFHPHNISAVIRSADAFGIADLHVIGNNFSSNQGIALGSERWITFHRYNSGQEAAQALSAAGYALVVLEPEYLSRQKSHLKTFAVSDLPFNEKLAIVLGSEKQGVSPELKAQASFAAHIPMYGFVESFNVSVACAITLFCSTLKGRKLETLSDTEQAQLLDYWLRRDIDGSDLILKRLGIK
ncbi:RNA methyltransferase [bacterium]|nr:RNA methyltransferase [bacterium]